MIAYNHHIKFISELGQNKKIEDSFTNVITVREGFYPDLDKKLLVEADYNNNQGRNVVLHTDRAFSQTVAGQFWTIEIKGVVTFYWYSGSLTLEYIKQENFTEELMKYWCLHIVLPLFFTLEERYFFLHAGAVEVEGRPILFVAQSFGGKSTMTDFFMSKEHTMISDDKVAIVEKSGEFLAIASHPHHRPYREKEDLGFYVENFAEKPAPMHTVYALERTGADDEINIREVKGKGKFDILYQHSEMTPIFQRQKRFEHLMKMANKVPVFTVKVPWSMARLEEVYVVIVRHSKELRK